MRKSLGVFAASLVSGDGERMNLTICNDCTSLGRYFELHLKEIFHKLRYRVCVLYDSSVYADVSLMLNWGLQPFWRTSRRAAPWSTFND